MSNLKKKDITVFIFVESDTGDQRALFEPAVYLLLSILLYITFDCIVLITSKSSPGDFLLILYFFQNVEFPTELFGAIGVEEWLWFVDKVFVYLCLLFSCFNGSLTSTWDICYKSTYKTVEKLHI